MTDEQIEIIRNLIHAAEADPHMLRSHRTAVGKARAAFQPMINEWARRLLAKRRENA